MVCGECLWYRTHHHSARWGFDSLCGYLLFERLNYAD